MIGNTEQVNRMDRSKLQLACRVVDISIVKQLSLSRVIGVSPERSHPQSRQFIQSDEYERLALRMKQLQVGLQRQKEKNYILREYFKKIEKIIYSESTSIFDTQPINYQQLQLHMREIVRRLQDIHNSRLKSAPFIYKNENVKVYRVKPKQNN